MPSDTRITRRGVADALGASRVNLPSLPVFLALLGIGASEAAVFYGYAEYALWGNLLTLVYCTLAPVRFRDDASLFQALVLLPVFRLVNLGMPVFFELTIYWLPMVYAPFIPAAYIVARSQPSVRLSVGHRGSWLVLPVAVAASAVLGIVEYAVISPQALVPAWDTANLLLAAIVVFSFVAVVEELLYRGIVQRVFQHRLGRWSGLVVASLLFGLVHSGYGIHQELLFAAAVGFLFGLVYDYTESFPLVVLMHGVLNFVLFVVVPYHPWLVPALYEYLPGASHLFGG